jgi:hypothetical protein
MLFLTCHHYDIYTKTIVSIPEEQNINKECFICYEITDITNTPSIKLGNQPKYLKKCKCDIFIHVYCLDKWYNINNSCPICRNQILLKTPKNICNYYIKEYTFTSFKILFIIITFCYLLNNSCFIFNTLKLLKYVTNEQLQ